MSKLNMPKLLFFIILAFLPGIIGSVFTADAINTWYVELNKPSFNPPNWIFGPVWTTLYILIGISGYLYSQTQPKSKLQDYFIYITQLILNGLWSIVFFAVKSISGALVIILIMDLLVFANIIQFNKKSRLAAGLLIPYLVWILFATVLNYNILILN